MHIESDVFRMLPRLEVLGLRDNDLNCLPIEELSYLQNLKTVRIDGNPWLCECQQKLNKYFRSRSIVQEMECLRQINICKKYQCMTPIGVPILSSVPVAQQFYNFNKVNTCNILICKGINEKRIISLQEHMMIHRNEFQTNVLTSLNRLPDKTTWIQISGLIIDTLPKYIFFRFGNSLKSLDLNDCRINMIENGAFAGLHKLQRLSLIGNRLPILSTNGFRDLTNLQQLILQRNEIEQIERNSLWHMRDTLRYLDIRDNLLQCIAIEELAELKKLERLNAMNNPWLCSCRNNLQNFLTQKNIGFEINTGRCNENENEILDNNSNWNQQQVLLIVSVNLFDLKILTNKL